MIQVKVYSVATSGTECVLLLEEADGPRLLPIWIGMAEGQAIALKFADIVLPRPMTHDLLVNTIEMLGYKIDQVIINDLKGQTFYAQIHISRDSVRHAVDSRPSDAIAVAVRAKCPIFVEDKVFEKCHTVKKPISEDEVKKFKDEIKNLKPQDIVKGLKDKKAEKQKEADEEQEGRQDESPGEEDESA
ncbi:MAG: bifunctional nuclease family protein [Elusimicrobia bacterium]|nr:bifunctional nuclease family protein [Elusimicrobiota bacterium]